MDNISPDIIAKIRAEVERHDGPEYARELLKEIDRLAMLVKSAPQGDPPEPPSRSMMLSAKEAQRWQTYNQLGPVGDGEDWSKAAADTPYGRCEAPHPEAGAHFVCHYAGYRPDFERHVLTEHGADFQMLEAKVTAQNWYEQYQAWRKRAEEAEAREPTSGVPAPQGDAAPDNEIILQTQVAVSVTPEKWNELQDELLLWRYRTLKALQHLKGFTGIRDLNELQAILDDDERRWKEIESGISVLLSDSDKAWMVPLAHKNGLTLGDWIIQTVRGAASSSGSAPELKDIKELDQAALDLAEKEYWRDNGDARHNLATAILTYLNAS